MGDLDAVAKKKKIKDAGGNKGEILMCLMSGFKESTGSKAPGRDEDQDGTHGEEDKRAVEVRGLTHQQPSFIYFIQLCPVNDDCCYSNSL